MFGDRMIRESDPEDLWKHEMELRSMSKIDYSKKCEDDWKDSATPLERTLSYMTTFFGLGILIIFTIISTIGICQLCIWMLGPAPGLLHIGGVAVFGLVLVTLMIGAIICSLEIMAEL